MAIIGYVGKQRIRREVKAWNITATTIGAVFTLTCNQKVVEYQSVSGDTTTTVAANLAAAVGASTDGEFGEMQASNSTNVLLLAGPADGAPITVSIGATGGGTTSVNSSLTVSPLSPFDAADGVNYSDGALPVNSDTLVIETPGTSIRYGLNALNSVTLARFRRAASHDGTIGILSQNPAGFREYRQQFLNIKADVIEIETTQSDQASAIRLSAMNHSATINIQGDGRPGTNREPVDLIDGSNLEVSVNRSGLSIAFDDTTTAGIGEIVFTDSTGRIGPSTNTVDNVKCNNSTVQIGKSFTDLTVNGGDVEVINTAAGTPVVHAGTLRWKSSGTITSPVVRSGAILSLAETAPAVAVSGSITLEKGATLADPASRLTRPYTVSVARADLADVTISTGPGASLEVS
jgi:hypothetical protein